VSIREETTVLTREENELLTRVGRGTPMGEMIRRFWVPACLSEELPETDGDPIRVRLLGEDLVAFRDTAGRAGVMQEHCPHRGASLFFGRNEEGGLRCLYHGWKMDVTGRVLDTPCEPPESMMKHHVRHEAYPVVEHGDVVWAYLGPKENQPRFSDYWWTNVPATHRCVGKIDYACNYLQAMEGIPDSAHLPVLHAGFEIMHWTPEQIQQEYERGFPPIPPLRVRDVEDTPYGFRYGNSRPDPADPEGRKLVSMTPMLIPFHTYLPEFPHMFVPADDEHTWLYDVRASIERPISRAAELAYRGERVGIDVGPDHRKLRTIRDNYFQDRQAMRERRENWSYTGIAFGKPLQDMLATESMGPIHGWEGEHLGVYDHLVLHLRQRLLAAVRTFMETGAVAASDPSIPWDRIRGGTCAVSADTPWSAMEYPDGVDLPAGVR
jgi:phthalate 4,5-dioxygenase oxygenase subunit